MLCHECLDRGHCPHYVQSIVISLSVRSLLIANLIINQHFNPPFQFPELPLILPIALQHLFILISLLYILINLLIYHHIPNQPHIFFPLISLPLYLITA